MWFVNMKTALGVNAHTFSLRTFLDIYSLSRTCYIDINA